MLVTLQKSKLFAIIVILFSSFLIWQIVVKLLLLEKSKPVYIAYRTEFIEEEIKKPQSPMADNSLSKTKSFKKSALDQYLSDRTVYVRNVQAKLDPGCKNLRYDAELPSVSVIIVFNNDPYRVLVRTVMAVLQTVKKNEHIYSKLRNKDEVTAQNVSIGHTDQDQTSPYLYLKEIILVDDASTDTELKEKLEHYLHKKSGGEMVKFIRLNRHNGLIQAKLAGARLASSDVLLFMDPHCEVSPDWLRPLLQRLKQKHDVLVMPVIDLIKTKYFVYNQGIRDPRAWVGGFSFDGHYEHIPLSTTEILRRKNNTDPARSPVMSGALFAINRRYFWEIGAYDEQMRDWGGENLEMSFRVWMCGGSLETMPCSHVGHISSDLQPIYVPSKLEIYDVLFRQRSLLKMKRKINMARMAEVWMDDYKEIFYLYHQPHLKGHPQLGDVSDRKMFREKLKCRSFQWYLENIYPEKFVPIRDTVGFGRFSNLQLNRCMDSNYDTTGAKPLRLYKCSPNLEQSQMYSLSLEGILKNENKCLETSYRNKTKETKTKDGFKVFMSACSTNNQNQTWKYLHTKQLLHVGTGLCLEARAGKRQDLYQTRLKPCKSVFNQKWELEFSEHIEYRSFDGIPDVTRDAAFERIRASRKSRTKSK